jgi:carbon storage regulator
MLVLSRQRDETIMIGDDIEVTVVDIRGDKVRLGITAPREISVHRKEVYDAIRRENRAAAQVKPEDLSGLGKVGPKGPAKTPNHGGPKPPGSPGQAQPPGGAGPGNAANEQSKQ